ncbi:MAG: S-methyl-5-thioribose-1-phosphate isomerase [Phycisphaerae bacterium]|nr:S-methyl-5-thioribose-1-phosphate isomerase [Phycisphaerae bacterium]
MADPRSCRTIAWAGELDGAVEMIDQTLLPGELKILTCRDVETLWEAIRSLRVRGAPAIGVAAAMGVVLGVRNARNRDEFFENLAKSCDYLAGSRPTAVNLFWALNRMKRRAEGLRNAGLEQLKGALLAEARAIRDEDASICRAIGEAGQHLIVEGSTVLTHCNAGGLATAEYGTALAVLYAAHDRRRRFSVYADETRPLLQGARLTAWELARAGLDVTVICDNMVAHVMRDRKVDLVVVGADRIAANGDTANKIGTYGVAVIANAHGIPFYVAAPRSTFDRSIPDGKAIPIEERAREEIAKGFGVTTVPDGVKCYNPAFDVTPAGLITGIITERGLVSPVSADGIAGLFRDRTCQR